MLASVRRSFHRLIHGYFPRIISAGPVARGEAFGRFGEDSCEEVCSSSRSMRAMSAAIRVRRVRVILPMLSVLSGCRSIGLLDAQVFGTGRRQSVGKLTPRSVKKPYHKRSACFAGQASETLTLRAAPSPLPSHKPTVLDSLPTEIVVIVTCNLRSAQDELHIGLAADRQFQQLAADALPLHLG